MAIKKKGNSKVTIYPDWCKGCGICVEFCPGKVLGLGPDGKAFVENEENCIRCGFCELHCPDFAIVVSDKEAVGDETNKDDAKASGKGAK